ncbi:MAG: hypothetical protein V4736_09435 [Bdellovibrionota bacterium]
MKNLKSANLKPSQALVLIFCALALNLFFTSTVAQAQDHHHPHRSFDFQSMDHDVTLDEQSDDEEFFGGNGGIKALGCVRATTKQISVINTGNLKKKKFLETCLAQTGKSPWCNQLVRPNPSSVGTFRCTYGASQTHQLIHPDEATWKNAIGAVNLIKSLEKKGLKACQIYNWWRPEPYNANVGGAAGRHPFATSVDVRMCSDHEAIVAFDALCVARKQGKIRAIGYYGGSALHFGVGDKTGNTWGRNCM